MGISFPWHIFEANEEIVNKKGEKCSRSVKHSWWEIGADGTGFVIPWPWGGNTVHDCIIFLKNVTAAVTVSLTVEVSFTESIFQCSTTGA